VYDTAARIRASRRGLSFPTDDSGVPITSLAERQAARRFPSFLLTGAVLHCSLTLRATPSSNSPNTRPLQKLA
jgi:hypothetical protein